MVIVVVVVVGAEEREMICQVFNVCDSGYMKSGQVDIYNINLTVTFAKLMV